jgi:hypothetical protein
MRKNLGSLAALFLGASLVWSCAGVGDRNDPDDSSSFGGSNAGANGATGQPVTGGAAGHAGSAASPTNGAAGRPANGGAGQPATAGTGQAGNGNTTPPTSGAAGQAGSGNVAPPTTGQAGSGDVAPPTTGQAGSGNVAPPTTGAAGQTGGGTVAPPTTGTGGQAGAGPVTPPTTGSAGAPATGTAGTRVVSPTAGTAGTSVVSPTTGTAGASATGTAGTSVVPPTTGAAGQAGTTGVNPPVGGSAGTTPTPPTTTAGATIVPLYTDPSDSSWSAIVAAKMEHPKVGVVAIVNPADGPGSAVNRGYTSGIPRLTAAGIKVIGYVATGYAAKSPATIKADIDRWKAFYPGQVTGIFFDEQSNKASDVAFYKDLSQYAKSQGLSFTVGNPGTDTAESFIGALDVMLIYESDGLPSTSQMAGWHANYAPSNFGIIPYATALDATFVKGARKYVQYIYLQSDSLPNPWDSLPSYFSGLLGALE